MVGLACSQRFFELWVEWGELGQTDKSLQYSRHFEMIMTIFITDKIMKAMIIIFMSIISIIKNSGH